MPKHTVRTSDAFGSNAANVPPQRLPGRRFKKEIRCETDAPATELAPARMCRIVKVVPTHQGKTMSEFMFACFHASMEDTK